MNYDYIDEKRTSPPPAPPTLDAPVVFRESIDMITKSEFSKIPGYVVGRMTLQKLNEAIGQLNILVQGIFCSSRVECSIHCIMCPLIVTLVALTCM